MLTTCTFARQRAEALAPVSCTKALPPKIRFLHVRGTEAVNGVSENVCDEATLVVRWLVRVRREHQEHPIESNEHKMNSKTRTIDSERGGYRRGKESQKALKQRTCLRSVHTSSRVVSYG